MTLSARLLKPMINMLLCSTPLLWGQAATTASRVIDISPFASISEVSTGIGAGRNTSITAGVSFRFERRLGLSSSAELRGTTPTSSGSIVSEKTIVGGLQLAKPVGRLRPFADILFGRGQLGYSNDGVQVPQRDIAYTKSSSNLVSPGVGVLYDINDKFSLRADLQKQYFRTPVTGSGSATSTPVIFGIAYHFPCTTHGHPYPNS